MTSPLATFFDELRTRWEAVTPPDDGSGLAYKEPRDVGELGGAGAHRTWGWERRLEVGLLQEQSGSSTTVRYRAFPTLILHRGGRAMVTWLAAIADETELLRNAWSLDAAPWSGDGSIREVLFTNVVVALGADEARATFTIEVEVRRGGT